MLNTVAGLGGLFSQKVEHPLLDPRELRRVLSDLPKDNSFKSLDEIAGWLESLLATQDASPDRIFLVVTQLDDLARPHLKRMTREYLNTARQSRSEEKRLWSINSGVWQLLAKNYERCLLGLSDNGKSGEQVKAVLPSLCPRLIGALAAVMKWGQFHYGPTPGVLWRQLGHALLSAEAAGVANKVVTLGAGGNLSSAQQEFNKVMVFHAASLDSLLPHEIELAERLIEHFLPHFVFTSTFAHDSVYWFDLCIEQPPLRLAQMPKEARPSQRFFKPGLAHEEIRGLLGRLEQGNDMPADINLGGQYSTKTLIPVLRHLAAYLAPIPPQRKHDRHRVKHRMSVLHGLINGFVVFSGEFGGRPAGLQIESWVVENVSRGGFGAELANISGDWLKVGALVAVQPEGGDNWLLGIVRRYNRLSDNNARVGIETVGRQIVSAELKVRSASSYAAVAGTPALMILDGNAPGELRVVLPMASFDLRESLEYTQDGRRHLLTPVALLEQTADYEFARYRHSLIT